MGTEASFLKPILTNTLFFWTKPRIHIVVHGRPSPIQWRIDLVYKVDPAPWNWRSGTGILYHTYRWPLPNHGFTSLHILPGPASPNLFAAPLPVKTNFQSFSRRWSHGETQLKSSLSENIKYERVSRGHCSRKANSYWQKWGSSTPNSCSRWW